MRWSDWADERLAPGRLELIRAFVNTRDVARGPEQLASAAAARDWLVERGLADANLRVGADAFQRVLRVREAFRSLLLANGGAAAAAQRREAAATLNDVAVRAGLTPRLAADGTPQLVVAARGVDKALGTLAGIMFEALAAGSWERLRACPGCQWAFYDSSRNRSSRWCDMAICGNRAKQRALRDRRQSGS